jgi:hypothetical protein
MELKELNAILNKVMQEQNNRGLSDFEGLSPSEMHQLLHYLLRENCPVQMLRLSEPDLLRVPILNLARYLLDRISVNGELQLTNRGFLPPSLVKEIYEQGFILDEGIESGIVKLTKEVDSMSINLTRILLELAGLTKKRNGKLSQVKSAKNILADPNKILQLIFLTFATQFNWAYYDGYEENLIGQLGFGYTLVLLSRYGDVKRRTPFYEEKYFRAFPQLLQSITPIYGTVERYAGRCYSLRTFKRFLDFFGLIMIEHEPWGSHSGDQVIKTDLFDKFLLCRYGEKK